MKNIYLTLLLCSFVFTYSKAQSYTSSILVSGLQYPVSFEVAPDGRFFITEKGDGSNSSSQNARIRVYNATGTLLGTFYDLSDSTISSSERGVLGIALDPDFATNHFVYVYYNHLFNTDQRIRIVRFTELSNVGTNPRLIFDLDVDDNIPGNHVGGNIHFRPSQPNHVYFTLGELAYQQTNPTLNYANKINNPYGKILRIQKDGTVPTDNPYYDDGNPLATNCDWIWSYGLRNPFDFCFSTVNDSLYCSENGLNQWDEVNLISKGGFYGWADCEGYYINSSTTVSCTTAGAIAPLHAWGSPLPSVTGVLFYSGNAWPALTNHLLVADYNDGSIYDCTLGNAPQYNTITSTVLLGDITTGGLTTLKQSADGCIYAMNGGYTTNGLIYKICPLTTVGIDETNTASFSMIAYPNPATDHLSIELYLSEERTMDIQLMDVVGKIVMTETRTGSAGKTTIDINLKPYDQLNGLYLLRLKDKTTGQELRNVKVLIE